MPPSDAEIIEAAIIREGGEKFTNDPSDRGGATKWGITATTLGEARGLGRAATADEVKALTGAEARDIYRQRYVEAPGFTNVTDDKLRALLVDSAIQHGPGTAVQFLQRALGVKDDGILGGETLAKLGAALPQYVYREVWNERAHFYAKIVQRNANQRKFAGGWFVRLSEFA